MGVLHENQLIGASGAGADAFTIDSSLRFNDDDSAYLSWTPSSAGNRKTWTFSCWLKRGNIGITQKLFTAGTTGRFQFQISSDKLGFYEDNSGAEDSTSMVLRDPSAWYHVVLAVDTTQSTAVNRQKMFVNGVHQTSLVSNAYITQNTNTNVGHTVPHYLGVYNAGSPFLDGYLAEVNFIDGSALAPTDFGEFDATYGHWKAKKYAGSYTGNSFYLPFTNDTTNDHFNTVVYAPDGSTSFAVTGVGFQPDLVWLKSRTYAEDHQLNDSVRGVQKGLQSNLTAAETSQSNGLTSFDSDGFTVGNLSDYNYNGDSIAAWGWKAGGPHPFTDSSSSEHSITKHGGAVHSTAQNKIGNSGISFGNGSTSYLTTPASSDFNVNSGDFTIEGWFRANNFSNGQHRMWGFSHGSTSQYMALRIHNSHGLIITIQNGSNQTELLKGGAIGDWSVNTWYHIALVMNGTNLKIYVNGTCDTTNFESSSFNRPASSSYPMTVGYSSENTSGLNWDGYIDEFRVSNTARYTSNFTPSTTAFTSDSNTKLLIHSDYDPSNTDGSITSSVSANPDQGFSIVSYTGTGSNATVGHGLSSAPEMVIVKNRDGAHSWAVYHTSIPNSKALLLNSTSAQDSSGGYWNNTSTTSSVFTVGNGNEVNYSGNALIAYCWHSVAGYSKIGSYTGNGSTTGPVITTGFKVGWLLIKNTDNASSWTVWDNKRGNTEMLRANSSNAEQTKTDREPTFTSTGFTVHGYDADTNQNGDNFIYMAIADTSAIGDVTNDQSGLKNHWAGVNLTASDVMLDSPTNNFATLNPLDTGTSGTLSEANLKWTGPSGSTYYGNASTFIVPKTGKWYIEFTPTVMGSYNTTQVVIAPASANRNSTGYNATGAYSWANSDDEVRYSGNAVATGVDFTISDVIGIAVNNGIIVWYKNNSAVHTHSTNMTTVTDDYFVGLWSKDSSSGVFNFGQDATFAGNKSPSTTYSDGDYGEFFYEPPSGFKALCSLNLPDPAVVPGEHFNALTYTGNGTTNLAITGVGFQADLSWFKARVSESHGIWDSVRGVTKRLVSNSSAAEVNQYGITTWSSDGFTVTNVDAGATNDNNVNYVSWNWKAGGTAVSNTNGSITSSVSANTNAGFSIVSYTGNATSGATVGHGLSSAPELVIYKNRSVSDSDWIVYSEDVGATKYLTLNSTGAEGTNSEYFDDTAPTASLLTIDVQYRINGSGNNLIAYCFHSVDGFSKIGSYTGNGNADGSFIYTGFQPKYLMIKRTDSAVDWIVNDGARDIDNATTYNLYPNLSAVEDSGSERFDFVSNGFKLRTSSGAFNGTSNSFIYMAFAEFPFKYANAR